MRRHHDRGTSTEIDDRTAAALLAARALVDLPGV
jgi:hypothetical protein